jgi:hypothetical protein
VKIELISQIKRPRTTRIKNRPEITKITIEFILTSLNGAPFDYRSRGAIRQRVTE